MIQVTVPDTDSVTSFVANRVEKFVELVKDKVKRDASNFIDTIRERHFKNLRNKQSLFGALRRFRDDQSCNNYTERNKDINSIYTLLNNDQTIPGTQVVRISDLRNEFPLIYTVETRETEQGKVTGLQSYGHNPSFLPLIPDEYISRDLLDSLNQIFTKSRNAHELKVLDASHDALLKAIEKRRSMFKRVFGLALAVLSKEKTATPVDTSPKVNFDEFLTNQTDSAELAFIADVYKGNKDNAINPDSYKDKSQVTVVDTLSGLIYKDAKLVKALGKFSFLYDRGRKGNTYVKDLTDNSLVFDPNVAKIIEKKTKSTIRSFSGLYVDRLKKRLKQR